MKPENRKRPKRIAHIAGGLTTGGVESMIFNYCNAFKQTTDDYEYVYISYNPPLPEMQRKFESIGFSVYSVTKKTDNFFKSCREVNELFKKHDINIVHSHMTLMCFVTSFIAILCGIKVRISHAHLALFPKGPKMFVAVLCRFLTKLTSTHWFACGKAAGIFLYGQAAVKSNRVKIINNAIDPNSYKYNPIARQVLRDKHSIGNRLCIGNIGRFTNQKNHSFLVDVFSAFHRNSPESVLLLIGNGPLNDEIKQKVNTLGLNEHVIFTGSIQNANEYYSAMDLFLLPSLYEGLALVMVEVQFAGLPAIVSDTVTSEIDIAGALKFLPLNESLWINALEVQKDELERFDVALKMQEAGYDIFAEATKLNEMYSSALFGGKVVLKR